MLPEHLWFYTIDGKVLKSKEDFVNYVKGMNEDIWNYHKEHFYNWLLFVFKDCRNACIIKFCKNLENVKRKISL